MKLSEILSVSGAPGLFKYVAQSKSGIIVEAIDATKRRSVVSGSAKVSTLGDIAIFTNSEEVSIGEVFDNIYAKNSGKEVAISGKSTPEELVAFLTTVLPEFDRSRVHNSDIKKLAQWYNILITAGVTEFTEKEETPESETEESANDKNATKSATTKKTTVKKPAIAAKPRAGAAISKSKVTATKSTTARKAQ